MNKIYLAGPDVFLSYAIEQGKLKKDLCKEYGFEGLFPFDNEVDFKSDNVSNTIYRANVAMMKKADIGIFNLTPFRGPSADVGTVFELGLMTGMNKRCIGYTNDNIDYLTKVYDSYDTKKKIFLDKDEFHVENFDLKDNLMIEHSLEKFVFFDSSIKYNAEYYKLGDLFNFRRCLEYLKENS